MRGLRFVFVAIASLATAAFFAVGCSSTGTSVPVAPIGAVLAPPLPAAATFAASNAVTPPTSAAATTLSLPLPGNDNYSGTATFPVTSVPPNLRLTLTYSNKPPSGLAPFAALRRSAATQRNPLDAFSTNAVYACFAANYVVTLNGAPTYTFVLPPGWDPAGIAYYMALWQNGQWVSGYGGPGNITASASATTINIAGRFPFVIPADGKVCVALYGRWTTAPTPVPPTPEPSTVLAVTGAPITLNAAGELALPVGTTETLSIAAADAPATATTTCTTNEIATLSGSPGASFTLTGTAVGTCAVTITNGAGKTVTVQVIVSPQTAPTPTPTVPPSPSILPAALTFTSTGVEQSLVLTETGYTGTLTQSNTCTGLATVSPASGTGPSATFTVASVAAGSCTVTIADSAGRSASASIGITTLGVTIQSKARRP